MKPARSRRKFIQQLGLSGIPFFLPASQILGANPAGFSDLPEEEGTFHNFVMDGKFYSPRGYIKRLQEIDRQREITEDMYFQGGVTGELEQKFADLTGKEKALYLPTGTMANQVAISLLSGGNAKVLVPENSHIFRDEADAAQRIHHKRLVPYGQSDHLALLEDLKKAETHTLEGEVFQSGLNTVVVENPVRRVNGRVVPFEALEGITNYCREKEYKLHLDGARLHLASVYTGISVSDYASLFDTVYISLYKYLNAGGGAVLCGDAEMIGKAKEYMKVLGGTMWQSWYNTAMALEYLDGFEERWSEVLAKGRDLLERLNRINGIRLSALDGGTNVYLLETGSKERGDNLVKNLVVNNQIYLREPDADGRIWFYLNESTSAIPNEVLEEAFEKALNS